MKSLSLSRPRYPLVCGCLFALLLLLTASPVNAAKAAKAKQKDISDTIASTLILSKFATLIQAAELNTFLSSKGPLTVFAPTNSAFARIPQATLDALLRPENKERLQHIVLFQVLNGRKIYAIDFIKTPKLNSCEGNTLNFKVTKAGTETVNKARVVHADIKCSNGVVHEIDTLLIPPEASMPPLVLTPPPPALDTNAAPVSPTPPATAPAETNSPAGVQ